MKPHWSIPTRFFILTLVVIGLAILAWVTREMFGPLLVAGLIAFILNPLVRLLVERAHFSHRLAVNLVYFLSLGLLIAVPAILIPVFLNDLQTLSRDLLDIVYRLQSISYQPIEVGGFVINLDTFLPRPDQSLALFIGKLPENAGHIIESTSKNAAWFLVILVSVYYLMMDGGRVREWLIRLAPKTYRSDVRRLASEIKAVWAAYLRGQLVLMFIVGVIFSLVWLAIGLPGAIILGSLTGLFSLVPEIGPLAASALAFVVALLEGSTYLPLSNGWFGLLVVGIYLVLINFKNIWLRPRVMGRSVNLNEGLVFVAIIAAVIFSGILGALVVVPLLASAIVLGRYLRARIFGEEPFPPQLTPMVSETEIPPEPIVASKLRQLRKPSDNEE
jgi:predicted PurR-regulated permease PerM